VLRRQLGGGDQLEVGVKKSCLDRERFLEMTVLVGRLGVLEYAPYDLDVLLRHRPPSISLTQGLREGGSLRLRLTAGWWPVLIRCGATAPFSLSPYLPKGSKCQPDSPRLVTDAEPRQTDRAMPWTPRG